MIVQTLVTMPYLSKEQTSKLDDVEKGVRNKWRWEWLQEKDAKGEPFESWVRKIDSPGLAFCAVCLKSIKYRLKYIYGRE